MTRTRRILLITPLEWRRPALVILALDHAARHLTGPRQINHAALELTLGTPPVDHTGELEAHRWADRHGITTRPHPPEYDLIDQPTPIDIDLASNLIALAAPDLVVAFDRFLSTNWDRLLQAASVAEGIETWRFSDNAGRSDA